MCSEIVCGDKKSQRCWLLEVASWSIVFKSQFLCIGWLFQRCFKERDLTVIFSSTCGDIHYLLVTSW